MPELTINVRICEPEPTDAGVWEWRAKWLAYGEEGFAMEGFTVQPSGPTAVNADNDRIQNDVQAKWLAQYPGYNITRIKTYGARAR